MDNLNLKSNTCLSIVIPCYNEEEVLPETSFRITELLSTLIEKGLVSRKSSVWLIDDGSKDRTWSMITDLCKSDAQYKGIKLARNRGHQNALLAGLETADGDILISVDADLQDDLGAIERMIEKYHSGNDIVYGVRISRQKDTYFKKFTAQGFYWLLQKFGVDIVYNHADYRLMSRRTIEALKEYSEVNLFLRGIIPTIGYSTSVVTYERAERFAGESKYPLRKMLALAFDGITSFSAVPLRIIAALGFLIFLFSMGISAWALFTRLFTSNAVPGWASSVLPMYVLGGIQLLSTGVLGEYIAKVYMETKRRPRYLIDTLLVNEKERA